MLLSELLVPTFTHMLKALKGWLDKAETHCAATGAGNDALLLARLAPDMYPLATQIRFTCFQAQEPVYRLQGQALPEPLLAIRKQGSNAGEQPGTWAEARACVTDTIAFLEGLDASLLDATPDLPLALDLPNGMIFDLTRDQYARDWSLPQFYFHLNTAYAILRHHGVPLGKADYVSYMRAYIRPGLAPQG